MPRPQAAECNDRNYGTRTGDPKWAVFVALDAKTAGTAPKSAVGAMRVSWPERRRCIAVLAENSVTSASDSGTRIPLATGIAKNCTMKTAIGARTAATATWNYGVMETPAPGAAAK